MEQQTMKISRQQRLIVEALAIREGPRMSVGRPRKALQGVRHIQDYTDMVMRRMRAAVKSWPQKLSVFRRYIEFLQHQGMPLETTDEQVAVFFLEHLVTKGDLSPQSAIQYGSHLKHMFRASRDITIAEYSAALRKQLVGPEHQAPCMSRQSWLHILEYAPQTLKAQIWLMWKTASRAEDWMHVSPARDVVLLSESEIAVFFSQTKTATADQVFRPDHALIVREEDGIPAFVRSKFDLIPAQALETVLRKISVPTAEECSGTTMRQWGAHSIKRGAATHLLVQLGALTGTPEALPEWVFPLLLKHRHPAIPIAAQDMRYVGSRAGRMAGARLLLTHRTTSLL